jgi:cation transport regulator
LTLVIALRSSQDLPLMPYTTNDELPAAIQRSLPSHAQDIFRSAFNAAWQSDGAKDPLHREEIAHRVAWAAVKKRYRMIGTSWQPIASR